MLMSKMNAKNYLREQNKEWKKARVRGMEEESSRIFYIYKISVLEGKNKGDEGE